MGESQSLRMAELHHRLGLNYIGAGKDGKAEGNFQRAIQGSQDQLGEQALPTLRITYQLGKLFTCRGEYDKAETLLRRAFEGLESAPDGGPRHEYTSDTVASLADLYEQRGRSDEAERLIRRALNGHGNNMDLETCPPVVVDLFYQLIWVYLSWDSSEKLEDAERLSERLLKAKERRYGSLHPRAFSVVNAVAALHRRQGRLREAEDQFARLVQGSSRVLGHNHPNTLIARHNLASVYMDQRRWAEARETLEGVIREWKRSLGTEYLSVYKALVNLGWVYHMQGELDKAEEAFRDALSMKKQMADGQQKVADVDRWLDHLEEIRKNGGVCGCGMSEVDESRSAHSPDDTAGSPVAIEDPMEALTTSELLGADTPSNN